MSKECRIHFSLPLFSSRFSFLISSLLFCFFLSTQVRIFLDRLVCSRAQHGWKPTILCGALPGFPSYQRTTYFKHLTHRVLYPLPLAHCREAHWPEMRTPLRESLLGARSYLRVICFCSHALLAYAGQRYCPSASLRKCRRKVSKMARKSNRLLSLNEKLSLYSHLW